MQLWIDSTMYNQLPLLAERYDFVMVSDEQFEEFDSFVEKETVPGIRLVESNTPLEY